jgi:hypothetical protein
MAEQGGDVGVAEAEPHRIGHPQEPLMGSVRVVMGVRVLTERFGHRVDEEPVGQAQLGHG